LQYQPTKALLLVKWGTMKGTCNQKRPTAKDLLGLSTLRTHGGGVKNFLAIPADERAQ
jgi:hypothetical protein